MDRYIEVIGVDHGWSGMKTVSQVETMRTMLTQSFAVLMPFNVQELNDGCGCYYGINQVSKNINIGNSKKQGEICACHVGLL